MVGELDRHAGVWNSSSQIIQSNIKAGPVVLFNMIDRRQGDVLILSPFTRFMATSMNKQEQVLGYGVVGSMLSIPANYDLSLVVFYSPRGVNERMREWGHAMRRAFHRTIEHRLKDITVNYLGYYTHNGGYYYYNTESGLNYEETMVAIREKISVPFNYLQIDSWWYYKGIGDGVSEWSARPYIFPKGIPEVHRRTKYLPMAAHNRYWSADTAYAKKYAFVIDLPGKKSLPCSNDSFWLDLLGESARDWGLILYEQDWLNVQTVDFTPTLTDIYLGHWWLTSMGAAADQIEINIQY